MFLPVRRKSSQIKTPNILVRNIVVNVINLIMFYILFLFIVTKNIIEFIFSHSSHRDLSKVNLEKYKILCFLVQSFYMFYSK